MPRRPSAIAAVMSRSLSSMARSLGNRLLSPVRANPRPPTFKPSAGTSRCRREDARPLPVHRAALRTVRRARARGSMACGTGGSWLWSWRRPLVAGYIGAAAFSAWSAPASRSPTTSVPDDGLTRYVVRAATGAVTDDLLAALEGVDGVVSAQRLHDGGALVATEGLAPHHLEIRAGRRRRRVLAVGPRCSAPSPTRTSPGTAGTWTTPGSNAYGQSAIADADVDAPEGWDGATGAGVIVAVIDTGYDSDHPDLAGALWTNPDEPCGSADTDGNGKAGDCHGWNFTTNSPDVDNGSYGTHGVSVSGVVGARAGNGQGTAGVAPDVTIMPLVIGSGSSVDMVLGAEAIRYAVDHGADVINASWGGPASGWALANLRAAVAYAARPRRRSSSPRPATTRPTGTPPRCTRRASPSPTC